MRKHIIAPVREEVVSPELDWLDLETLAEVEVTSEADGHPVESALLPGGTPGWRAAGPGPQTVRLRFDDPQYLRHIRLRFKEDSLERTQEYVLRWSPDGGQTFRDITRQQWNFSPRGATCEMEDFSVDLPAVTVLELSITPDIAAGPAIASLVQLRLA